MGEEEGVFSRVERSVILEILSANSGNMFVNPSRFSIRLFLCNILCLFLFISIDLRFRVFLVCMLILLSIVGVDVDELVESVLLFTVNGNGTVSNGIMVSLIEDPTENLL